MRVVDVNEFYSPTGGGVRTYIDRKMGIMADLGHELIVIAPAKEDSVEDRPGGGRIIWVKAPAMPFDKNYGMFWDAEPVTRHLDVLNADVVEATSPWRPAWIVGKWQGDAVKVVFMHNDPVASYPHRWFEAVASRERIDRAFEWYNRYARRFISHFDAVVTNGPALQKRLAARDVRVDRAVPLGIEASHFSPQLRDPKLRAALLGQCGLPEDAMLLLGLGRHHPEKRWPLIVDAVGIAGADIPVGLVLIGDGINRKLIERRVAESPHIRMFKPVYDRERLARIMASCDALAHGNETEAFGLVASEAIASGLPLIGPDEGGCAEVADPRCSELYVSRDARSCAEAIKRMYARDKPALRAAAIAAAARVHTDRDHAIELMAYYSELVARRRAA